MKLFDVRTTLALFCATIFVCNSATWWETYQYGGWRITSGFHKYARHIEDCTLRCLKDYPNDCTAVSFNTKTYRCIIGTAPRKTVVGDTMDSTVVVRKTPLLEALFVGYRHGSAHYSYNYSQAYDICKMFRGRLMNGTELEDRFNTGEHMCQCGWTMDGPPMYSDQGGNSSCGVAPGVIACNTTLAHAWCTMLF